MTQPGMFLSQPPIVTSPSKPSAADDGLDRVGDDLARHERIAHAGRAHRDAVGDGDRVEKHALRAGGVGARSRVAREAVDVHVAGRDHAPGRGDADLRLREIRVREADGAQHGAARRLRKAVDDDARVPARIDAGGILVLISHAFEDGAPL